MTPKWTHHWQQQMREFSPHGLPLLIKRACTCVPAALHICQQCSGSPVQPSHGRVHSIHEYWHTFSISYFWYCLPQMLSISTSSNVLSHFFSVIVHHHILQVLADGHSRDFWQVKRKSIVLWNPACVIVRRFSSPAETQTFEWRFSLPNRAVQCCS